MFLALAPKSNAVYAAFGAAMEDAKSQGTLDVPLHLRNAPTRLMKELGYGKGYRYAHDEPDALAPGQTHFPDTMEPRSLLRAGATRARNETAGDARAHPRGRDGAGA